MNLSRSALAFALLLLALTLIIMSYQPVNASLNECVAPFGMQATPAGMATWLWGEHQSDLIAQYPQLTPDANKPSSPLLKTMIEDNTTLAKQLSWTYGYGVSSFQVTPNDNGVHPYAVDWDPNFLAVVGVVGDSVQGMYDCLHNVMGFDHEFTYATINLIHTSLMFMQRFGSYSLTSNIVGLDPAIYGNKTYVVVAPEPGFVLRRDGHVVFGDPCPVTALYYYDNATPTPNLLGEESVAGCFGNGYVYLIVPETVIQQIGLRPAEGCQGFLSFMFGGNGDSAFTQEISRENSSPKNVQIMAALEKNWGYWQSSCSTLLNALKAYTVPGLNIDFSAFTRLPYDTRLPSGLKGQVIQESFPSPLDELLSALIVPSITLNGLWAESSQWGCQPSPSPIIRQGENPPEQPPCGGTPLNGYSLASTYAHKIYAYLQHYGIWQWAQSIIRPWLNHYFPSNVTDPKCNYSMYSSTCDGPDIATLPQPDFQVQHILAGTYAIFNYEDAFTKYSADSSVPEYGSIVAAPPDIGQNTTLYLTKVFDENATVAPLNWITIAYNSQSVIPFGSPSNNTTTNYTASFVSNLQGSLEGIAPLITSLPAGGVAAFFTVRNRRREHKPIPPLVAVSQRQNFVSSSLLMEQVRTKMLAEEGILWPLSEQSTKAN